MNILCQICNELIATTEKKALLVPLHGNMFQSPYPDRMPASLLESTEYEFIKCPMCGFRPFLQDDEVLTDKGIYKIELDFICDVCGKVCKSRAGLVAHMRSHNE